MNADNRQYELLAALVRSMRRERAWQFEIEIEVALALRIFQCSRHEPELLTPCERAWIREVLAWELAMAWEEAMVVNSNQSPSTMCARAKTSAVSVLEVLAALVPSRIANEEIGDALEDIHRMNVAGKPMWLVRTKEASTCFWVILHTVFHYAERAVGLLKVPAGLGGSKGDTKK